MSWTVCENMGVNNKKSYIYEATVTAGGESDVLRLPAFEIGLVTLNPIIGGNATLHFATNKPNEAEVDIDFETDADSLNAVTSLTTKAIDAPVTSIKVEAVTENCVARVVIR